jgi:transcriptional regulator GlxA family with amidase domain
MEQPRTQVAIVIFPDVEVLDFCGPFEVFSVTRLDDTRRRDTLSPFEVRLVAESRDVVTATGGLRVLPDCTLAECPAPDVLVVPGGWGTRRLLEHRPMLDWIAERGAAVPTLTSVCTGALLLGRTGLLDGRRATTHWRSLDLLREVAPGATVEDALHVVEDGRVVTSAGISAGIDMSLRVVARLYGEPIARQTARHMEYPYPEDDRRRI